MTLSPLLDGYDHVLLDLDGCVWVGERSTRDAPEALAQLRSAHKHIAFITNDAQRSGEDYVRKLWSLGIRASLAEVVTVGGAMQHVLAEGHPRGGTAYVIGSEAIFRHVDDAGLQIVNGTDLASRADVVVVASHYDVHYRELREAVQAVIAGAKLIAAGRDRTFPMPDGPWPGTGALVAALEYATSRTAEIVGKPDPQVFLTALDRLGPGRALAVGDRLDADLAGAAAAGLDAAIVLTGATSRAEAEAAHEPTPVAIAEDLAELVLAG
jgi:HAD superfamily hydrolase (TIGR01450 family)